MKSKELFVKIWNERNPQHESNADNGKDMFMDTAFMVAQDYAKHEALSFKNWCDKRLAKAEKSQSNTAVLLERMKSDAELYARFIEEQGGK